MDLETQQLEDELSFLNDNIKERELSKAVEELDELSEADIKQMREALEVSIRGQLETELNRIVTEQQDRVYLFDPNKWIEEKLDDVLWTKQKEIVEAISKNKRVAVPSCFGSGKSFIAARLVAWWIDTHPPGTAFVVTTATTGAQVKAILWREISRAHTDGKLAGRLNQTEWWLPVGDNKEEMVAFGRKPADMDPTAFQGIHAPYVLVVLDEAAGIPVPLFDAADALIVNDESRIIAIGNPEDGASEFAVVCKPGSGWKVIRIPAKCTPNFTGEDVSPFLKSVLIGTAWVEEKRKKWGEQSPMYQSKIEAEFPESTKDGLIPAAWVRAAQERSLEPSGIREAGVDVGAGGDKNVIADRHGCHVRIVLENQEPDTMRSCGNVIAYMRKTGAVRAKVDEIGIGRGLVDRAHEVENGHWAKAIIGVNVGSAPREDHEAKDKADKLKDKETFVNLRAQGYWELRERFGQGNIDIDPEDEELASQLISIKYKRTSAGKIQIESKQEMAARGIASPDKADGVMLAFLDPPKPKPRPKGATWGKKRN